MSAPMHERSVKAQTTIRRYHIVDARGRTIHVVPFDCKQRRTPRLHAERYAAELNAL